MPTRRIAAKPPPAKYAVVRLRRLPASKGARLAALMDKSDDGTLTAPEKQELKRLGAEVDALHAARGVGGDPPDVLGNQRARSLHRAEHRPAADGVDPHAALLHRRGGRLDAGDSEGEQRHQERGSAGEVKGAEVSNSFARDVHGGRADALARRVPPSIHRSRNLKSLSF